MSNYPEMQENIQKMYDITFVRLFSPEIVDKYPLLFGKYNNPTFNRHLRIVLGDLEYQYGYDDAFRKRCFYVREDENSYRYVADEFYDWVIYVFRQIFIQCISEDTILQKIGDVVQPA